MSLNIVLLGPPGAGKGTQAKVLSEHFTVVHVSTGDMLREAVKNGSESGKEAEAFMNKGDLVPDSIVVKLVIERIAKNDAKGGFLLDGFPRNEKQANALDRALRKASKRLDAVLYFRTSPEISIERLSGRRVCKKCGANFHVKNMPPKKSGVCDFCGAALYQRDDDKPETVKNRLVVYETETKSLIEYYKKKGILRDLSGDLNVEVLFEEIKKLLRVEKIA